MLFCFQSNSYNIDIAKIFGVRSAVLLSFLDKEISKSSVKQVAIERNFIYNSTGLDDKEQIDIEDALVSAKVLEVSKVRGNDNKHYYSINEQSILQFINSMQFKDSLGISSVERPEVPVQRRTTKREAFVKQLKGSIKVSDEALRQRLCDWIDSVYSNPKGFMSLQGLALSITELQSYSTDMDVIMEIMSIAIKGGYRDLAWAIDRYKQSHGDSDDEWKLYSESKADIQIQNGAF